MKYLEGRKPLLCYEWFPFYVLCVKNAWKLLVTVSYLTGTVSGLCCMDLVSKARVKLYYLVTVPKVQHRKAHFMFSLHMIFCNSICFRVWRCHFYASVAMCNCGDVYWLDSALMNLKHCTNQFNQSMFYRAGWLNQRHSWLLTRFDNRLSLLFFFFAIYLIPYRLISD